MTAPLTTALRWGALSTASIARVVVGANRSSRTTRFTAVASRDGARARAFADEFGIEHSFGSYREMLASDVIDAVYVALPISMHAEWVTAALQAGKHVLCEKPFTVSADDAQRCASAASSSGKRCVEGFMWRMHPQTALVRELIAIGAIGELSTINAALTVSVPAGDIRLNRDLGGGALYDLGCYCVSAVRLLGGAPEIVCATAIFEPDGVDRRMSGTVRTERGVLATFDVGLDLLRRDELRITGTCGVITVPDPWLCTSNTVELRTIDGVRNIPVPRPADDVEAHVYRIEFDAVSQAFAAGTALPFELPDAIEQASVISALMESARSGSPVRPRRFGNHTPQEAMVKA